MKFGHNLYRNIVPEYALAYLDYKSLKKGINAIRASSENRDADVAPFLFALDRELEKVDEFFNKRLSESLRRLKLLDEKFGQRLDHLDSLDGDEIGEMVGVLLELRSQLRKIIWFGDVNRRGFVKILKKLDKRLHLTVKDSYLCSKVNEKPFASCLEVTAAEKTVNTWLEKIGEDTQLDLNDETRSAELISQIRVSSGAVLGLPTSSVNMLDTAISNDDKDDIQAALTTVDGKDPKISSKILLNLLQRAVTSKAVNCIDLLLPRIHTLSEDDDINDRNVIHRVILSLGRRRLGSKTSREVSMLLTHESKHTVVFPAVHGSFADNKASLLLDADESGSPIHAGDPAVKIFNHLLDRLEGQQRLALSSRDCYGRIPLHYAAQFGFAVLCESIVEHMQEWGQFDGTGKLRIENYRDYEGFTPLHLAVMGNHYDTVQFLLTRCNVEYCPTTPKATSALALATKINSPELIRLLLKANLTVNFQDECGESALHVAARMGHVDCARALLEGGENQKINIELPEKTFGWTPLFIAAVDGHINIVNLLVDAGSDFERTDLSGWTAQEHAALRGHLDIARKLCDLSEMKSSSLKSQCPSSVHTPSTLSSSYSGEGEPDGVNSGSTKQPLLVPEPVKSFGHRYLQSKTLILVSLGSKDTRSQSDPVQLEKIPIEHAPAVQLGNALSLVVSAENASGERAIIDLPVQENISTEPISFEAVDITKVRLMFDLIPTYSGSHEGKIGRAVAILSSLKPDVGHGKVSLHGGVQVPLLAAGSLEVIGCVNFEFLVITPFSHPNMSITKNQTYWKSLSSPRVIGHRGLGKNQPSRQSLQLGENTLQSFISAANLGASYVEFDVQLTKDHVPVLYHDFLVGETGIDAPVHDLTLEQFLHISERQTPKSSRPPSPDGSKNRSSAVVRPGPQQQRRPRSFSLTPMDHHQEQELNEKMKYTRAFKLKGFKGNTRGSSIQGPIQTLANVFKDLPSTIGFNIELKYPMLQESENEDMDTFGIEMNFWVDTILKVVYDHANGRDLIFSSFNPDICLLLSFKQPSIPVLFLTEAGTEEMADIRACCLKEAIKFASHWNLLGIVSAAEPLVLCPRLVRAVKESGLVCVTYGALNNDPQNVKLQVEQGVDAVIVDSVLAIRKGLTDL